MFLDGVSMLDLIDWVALFSWFGHTTEASSACRIRAETQTDRRGSVWFPLCMHLSRILGSPTRIHSYPYGVVIHHGWTAMIGAS
jgi:hypothetical protein